MGTVFCCFFPSCDIMNKAALSLTVCVFWAMSIVILSNT